MDNWGAIQPKQVELQRTQPVFCLVEPVEVGAEVSAAVRAFAAEREPAILESVRRDRFSRYTILACDPAEIVEIDGGPQPPLTQLRRGAQPPLTGLRRETESAIELFGAAVERALPSSFKVCSSPKPQEPEGLATPPGGTAPFNPTLPGGTAPFDPASPEGAALLDPASPVPFKGGWIGYLTYEAGLEAERIPAGSMVSPCLPFIRFGLYDAAAIYDHALGHWYAVAVEWGMNDRWGRPSAKYRIDRIRNLLKRAQSTNVNPTTPRSAGSKPRRASRTSAILTGPNDLPEGGAESEQHVPADYGDRFRKIQRYIAAGDVYQVNLAVGFRAETDADPIDLYLRLRDTCPAPYAAFLSWDDKAIISSSPELFLSLRDRHVVTRPIKGTRPRSTDPLLDDVYRRDLESSEKEAAELNMIVDLLRNDLGRVCEFGTVRVVDAGEIEAHPNVFHRVATISGELRGGANWRDLLRAVLPGGSITGVPKIRAMQIISELEPTARGVYCGAIGWIGLDGSMHLNLAIRTMTQIGRDVRYFAGGGIVADSVEQDEYNEILAKLSGMKSAVCGLQPLSASSKCEAQSSNS